jgi:pimeloyl-ACP methyl ester carboxylesterase
MKSWLCLVSAICCIALAGLPGLAQNTGGLPGDEHSQVLEVFKQAERVVIHDDVVHYSFDLIVGPGPFDKIRIHRVVRETQPYRPIKKMEGVLLLPGAGNLFETMFLMPAAPSVPAERGSVALFLASNDIDVWGLDYGWSFIPFGNSDFTPLKGWGLAKDAEHTEIALSIARWLRVTSGQGVGPIHLLGFSYGGYLAYVTAGEDTQRPGNLKNVKGIIAVDGGDLKAIPGSAAQNSACKKLPAILTSIEGGKYHTTDFALFRQLGISALYAPDEKSAFLPPFSNYQAIAALLVTMRFLAGSYSVLPPSVELTYSDASRLPSLAANAPPYFLYQYSYDYNASLCDSDDYPVTIDDHLEEITVPILQLARTEGGFYTPTLTGSDDVSKVFVNPPDYGHADLFLANNAADFTWQTIQEWILDHQ